MEAIVSNVIATVTTPIALAALVILVLTGYQQSRQLRRGNHVDNRAFWLILLFGLAANGIYVLKEFAFSDALLRGEVRQLNGKPLSRVTVDVAGIGQAATSDAGVFEISIPYSRTAPRYTLYLFSNGVPGEPIEIEGPRPEFLPAKFKSDVNIDNYLDTRDIAYISQNTGNPLITIGFRTKNEISGRVKVNVFEVKVQSPDGEILSFFPLNYVRNGANIQIGDIILDYENQSTEYAILSSANPGREMQLFQEIASEEGAGWAYNCAKFGAEAAIEEKLRNFFKSSFFWIPGEYMMAVRYRAEGRVTEKHFNFKLTEAESSQMYSISKKLRYCRGVASDQNQIYQLGYSDGESNNTILSNLKNIQ